MKVPVAGGIPVSELDAARVALERTIAGSTPGTVINGYAIHLIRPGGERHLVGVAEDEDLHPQVIQAPSAERMLDAVGRAWRFTDRFGEPEPAAEGHRHG